VEDSQKRSCYHLSGSDMWTVVLIDTLTSQISALPANCRRAWITLGFYYSIYYNSYEAVKKYASCASILLLAFRLKRYYTARRSGESLTSAGLGCTATRSINIGRRIDQTY
jgi:hypothetical protein